MKLDFYRAFEEKYKMLTELAELHKVILKILEK